MEKILLVMALMGSAYLAFRGLLKAGKLVFAFVMPKPSLPSTVRFQDVKPIAIRKDGEEEYDIPAFIRRGIPMPKLEPVKPVKPATRKRRSKAKAEISAAPATSNTAAFEVVA